MTKTSKSSSTDSAFLRRRGYITDYQETPLTDAQRKLFKPGKNVVAVHCRQTGGGQGVDLELLGTK